MSKFYLVLRNPADPRDPGHGISIDPKGKLFYEWRRELQIHFANDASASRFMALCERELGKLPGQGDGFSVVEAEDRL